MSISATKEQQWRQETSETSSGQPNRCMQTAAQPELSSVPRFIRTLSLSTCWWGDVGSLQMIPWRSRKWMKAALINSTMIWHYINEIQLNWIKEPDHILRRTHAYIQCSPFTTSGKRVPSSGLKQHNSWCQHLPPDLHSTFRLILHVTPLLQLLHWLAIAAHIKFRTLVRNFRSVHLSARPYLQSTVRFQTSSRSLCSTYLQTYRYVGSRIPGATLHIPDASTVEWIPSSCYCSSSSRG